MRHDVGRGQRATVAVATVLLLLASAGLAFASLGSEKPAPDLSPIRTDRELPKPSAPTNGSAATDRPQPSTPQTTEAPKPEKPSAGAAQSPSSGGDSTQKAADDEDDYQVVLPEVRDSDDEHNDSGGESKSSD